MIFRAFGGLAEDEIGWGKYKHLEGGQDPLGHPLGTGLGLKLESI